MGIDFLERPQHCVELLAITSIHSVHLFNLPQISIKISLENCNKHLSHRE